MAKESVFDLIAALVTVREIQKPPGLTIDVGMNIQDAVDELREAEEESVDPAEVEALVLNKGLPIGWVSLEDLECADLTDSLASVSTPIALTDGIAASTCVLELMDRWAKECRPLLVIDGKRLTGLVDFTCLYEIPARVCFLALTFELEEEALKLLLVDPDSGIEALPPGRIQKAREVFSHLQGKKKYAFAREELIRYTTLIDKGLAIKELRLLDAATLETVGSTFERAQTLRNRLAHTGHPIDLIGLYGDMKGLAAEVSSIREMITAIRDKQ